LCPLSFLSSIHNCRTRTSQWKADGNLLSTSGCCNDELNSICDGKHRQRLQRKEKQKKNKTQARVAGITNGRGRRRRKAWHLCSLPLLASFFLPDPIFFLLSVTLSPHHHVLHGAPDTRRSLRAIAVNNVQSLSSFPARFSSCPFALLQRWSGVRAAPATRTVGAAAGTSVLFSRAFCFCVLCGNKQMKKKSLRQKKTGGDRTPPRTFCKAFVRHSYYLPSSCCVFTVDEESVFRASCIETCTKGIADLMCLSSSSMIC
jgi:hypothetical protein